MNMEIIAAFLLGAVFMELIVFGLFLLEEYRVLRKLRDIEERQAAGEWLPADQC